MLTIVNYVAAALEHMRLIIPSNRRGNKRLVIEHYRDKVLKR